MVFSHNRVNHLRGLCIQSKGIFGSYLYIQWLFSGSECEVGA